MTNPSSSAKSHVPNATDNIVDSIVCDSNGCKTQNVSSRRSPDDIYYENAAMVAFLLVEQIVAMDDKYTDGWKIYFEALDVKNVSVTL